MVHTFIKKKKKLKNLFLFESYYPKFITVFLTNEKKSPFLIKCKLIILTGCFNKDAYTGNNTSKKGKKRKKEITSKGKFTIFVTTYTHEFCKLYKMDEFCKLYN